MLPGFSIEKTTKTTHRGTFTGWWVLRAGEPILAINDEPAETLQEALKRACDDTVKCYWCGLTKAECELYNLIPCCGGQS